MCGYMRLCACMHEHVSVCVILSSDFHNKFHSVMSLTYFTLILIFLVLMIRA